MISPLTQLATHPLGQHAADIVGHAARGKRNDQPDRLVGIGLGPDQAWDPAGARKRRQGAERKPPCLHCISSDAEDSLNSGYS